MKPMETEFSVSMDLIKAVETNNILSYIIEYGELL